MKTNNRSKTSGNNYLKLYIVDGLDFYWIYYNNNIVINCIHRIEDNNEETISENKILFESIPLEIRMNSARQAELYYNIK